MRNPDNHFETGLDRLVHIRKVMHIADTVEGRLSFGGRLVVAAAYHDLGYAQEFVVTGYHPVDGALLARSDGLDPEIVDAVLHHSGARALAERTRPDLMVHYGPSCRMMSTPLSRALTFCDNHAGPRGEAFTLAERLAEIRLRHASNPALMAVLDETLPQFEAIEAEFLSLLG